MAWAATVSKARLNLIRVPLPTASKQKERQGGYKMIRKGGLDCVEMMFAESYRRKALLLDEMPLLFSTVLSRTFPHSAICWSNPPTSL